ncbi:MAG: hypothetical protein F4X98_07680 [Gammaproteobacteria bacterium]|nr:hypothetical protein [Gammaproteobacteria bacterium]
MDNDAIFLDQTQKRLHDHFQTIAVRREQSGFPVFALEHCLTHDELDRVKLLLRRRLRNRQPLAGHWLLWAVYAAEVGYGYKGDEYWQSFEEQSPGWTFHDRDKVKAWFRKFHQHYRGVLPTGYWADHFTIIAWPITHAIVPKCLQRQFAKAMFDLRYRFASERDFDARTIGRLLAVNASHGSTRFQAFLEQEELTGQVVLALLGTKPTDEEELLHPPTLRRIVDDLEKVQRTRDWLKEARRVVADRFRGIGRGPGPRPPRPRPDAPAQPFTDTTHLTLRPTLMLRHDGAETWTPFLETRSFRGLAALSADLQSFLRRTRCRLNGADDMKPAGWLLSGNRKGVLRSWPDETRPLIAFERDHPLMTHVLDSDCRLSPGPLWLFRIAADGTAREITGRIVRPGSDYIVATNATSPSQGLLECTNPCRLECVGAQSFRLTVPPNVSADMTAQLTTLGLQVARTIDVWPAGLPGRNWDGEGRSEWLTTETPCFGIAYDHPVHGFDFRLGNGANAFVPSDSDHGPLFVRLPPLAPGTHLLTVKARRSADLEDVAQTPPAEGYAELDVREPEPWTPGVTSHPGLVVTADPHDADLDTLWTNQLRLSVHGPVGYRASFAVDLQAPDGRIVLSERVGEPVDLPVTPQQWREHFEAFVQNDARTWKYLEAAICELSIRGDTLGTCTLRFEHEPLPVRWVMRSNRGAIVIRLVDESEQDDQATDLRFYGIESPTQFEPIEPDAARTGMIVTPPGGLFVASHGRHTDTVVVSTPSTDQGFRGLGVTPRMDKPARDAEALFRLFQLLGSWRNGRLSGFLVDLRRRQVTTLLLDALLGTLCGKNWADAEATFKATPRSNSSIKALASHIDKRSGFGAALSQPPQPHVEPGQLERWFRATALHTMVCQDPTLCDFSLQLASRPFGTIRDSAFKMFLSALVDNPAVFRGARFLQLTGILRSPDTPATSKAVKP